MRSLAIVRLSGGGIGRFKKPAPCAGFELLGIVRRLALGRSLLCSSDHRCLNFFERSDVSSGTNGELSVRLYCLAQHGQPIFISQGQRTRFCGEVRKRVVWVSGASSSLWEMLDIAGTFVANVPIQNLRPPDGHRAKALISAN